MSNPYNLRGALLNPSGNESINYYFMIFDYDPSSQLDGEIILMNPEETGNLLNYKYTGDQTKFIAPIPGNKVNSSYLPIYYNQKIDKPDLSSGAQNLWVNLWNADGTVLLSQGNPYQRHPPIVEVIENSNKNPQVEPYICSSLSFASETASTYTSFIVVMVNSYQSQAVNPLIINSQNSVGGNGYDLICGFTPPSDLRPYKGIIAAVGACSNSGNDINNVGMNGSFLNPPFRPLNWNPNPPPDTLPVITF